MVATRRKSYAPEDFGASDDEGPVSPRRGSSRKTPAKAAKTPATTPARATRASRKSLGADEDEEGKDKSWHADGGSGLRGEGFAAFTAVAGALALMVLCPPVAILMWYVIVHKDGSVLLMYNDFAKYGPKHIVDIWPTATPRAWAIIASFSALQIFFMMCMPGKKHLGPVTPMGNVPVYKANGMQSYIATMAVTVAVWKYEIFNPVYVYTYFGEILAALNIFALALCAFLLVKGHFFPSSTDSGSNGNFIFDYYWGMELYPRIFGIDIKTFTNCRFGMMLWGVLNVCYIIAQYEKYGYVADSMWIGAILQTVYVAKFFWWETGYWGSMDIMHDRAGYYLCWGCLVWVPCIYTSPGLYLVGHPVTLGTVKAAAIAISGVACVWINYDADRQRQEFRQTNGKSKVWGKAPVMIKASYTTGAGEKKTSLLLCSGWWRVARHFHYLPEIMSSFFWTAPCTFTHALPYFYVVYLTILLADRAGRHDERCQAKYGKHWDQYCKLVPYKMLPYIY